jgi:GT2 family glycosyltransferase
MPTPARSEPLLSCIMIFLDGERFIEEAISSVVAQAGDWELVLVDDGSTDGSTAIARRWAAEHPARLRYVEHPGHANLGMSAARNAGLAASRGRYVGFLDCDDVWLPCVVGHVGRVLAANPGVDVVIGGTWRWYGWTGVAEDVSRDHRMSLPEVAPERIVEPPDLFAAIYGQPGGWRVPAMCSLVVRREALIALGGMEVEFRGLYEDQVLYTKLALHLRTVVDPRPLALYRQHSGSACERSVADGSWQRLGPSDAVRRFMSWVRDYVEAETGAGSTSSAIARQNIALDGWWDEGPSQRRWPRLRAIVPAPARRIVRRLGDGRRAPAGPSILAAWSEQYLRSAAAALSGRVLVVTGPGDEPWRDDVPDDAFRAGVVVVRWPLDAVSGSFEHVVVPVGAAERAGDQLFERIAAAVRPGGRATLLVPASATACADATAVETFGNTVTVHAIANGVDSAAVGVELDRHDPAVPVLVVLLLERSE